MKYLSIATSIIACVATIPSATLAQGPIQTCPFTATSCLPFEAGPTATITVYEVPFVQTTTESYDCQGCTDVTVSTERCYGLPPYESITTTTYVIEPESITTVAVCSPTPD